MLLKEFIAMTGFEPTTEEYAVIEEQYYKFVGNKVEFCNDFIANNDEMKILKARAERIEELKRQITELDKRRQEALKLKDAEISRLEAALEREQEWKPYVDPHNVKQADYDKLAKHCNPMSDEEAIDWVVQETGFSRELITIVHEIPEEEVNRHHQVRKTGKKIDRRPRYDATDYHYILFNVHANVTNGWELWNDELRPYYG